MDLQNKEEIREKANIVTNMLFAIIQKEPIVDNHMESADEAAYFLINIAALLNAKICVALETFSKSSNSEDSKASNIYNLIVSHTKTYLSILEVDKPH